MSYQNKNQNCSINKVQNLRNAEKFFSQIYKDLYGDAMLLPIQININMAAGNQQKHLSLS